MNAIISTRLTVTILCLAPLLLGLTAPVVLGQGSIYDNRRLQQQLIGGVGLLPDVEPPAMEPQQQETYSRVVGLVDENTSEAIDELRAFLSRERPDDAPPINAQFNFLLASLYYQEGKYNNAIEQFQEAISKWPSFRRAHKSLGVLLVVQQKYREALPYLTKVIELGGQSAQIYSLLGTSYIFLERYIPAEAALREAILLQPDNAEFKLTLVRVLFSQQKWDEALSLLNELIKENPDNPKFWDLQANAFLGREEYLEAAGNWEILRTMGELETNQLSRLAAVYVNDQLYDLAAERYLEAFEANPTEGLEGVLKAAEVLLARGAGEQAEQLLNEVRESDAAELTDADQQQILKLEAQMLMDRGEEKEAVEILEKLVDLNPRDGDSLLKLGKYYQDIGEPEQATFYYERAQNLDGFKADANVRLAQLKVEMKEYDEALRLLRAAQQINPRDQVDRFIEQIERFSRNR
jgi:tetratricopeptide (TPR) repeat protein